MKSIRSEDEEIVAIVENDACYVDAVQVLTGCTFGKGNFIYKDNGKMVLTLLSRKTGQGIRVAMRPGAFAPDETHLSRVPLSTQLF
jgi:formylmethanofuran dehydrogenase subunit E